MNANSEDPDQTLNPVMSDLNLHCFKVGSAVAQW